MAAQLRFRWERLEPAKGMYNWLCIYELAIPLDEYDIRREGADGDNVRSELVFEIGRTRVGSVRARLNDFEAPFRDGAHARWDAEHLRAVEIVSIGPDGTVHYSPETAGTSA